MVSPPRFPLQLVLSMWSPAQGLLKGALSKGSNPGNPCSPPFGGTPPDDPLQGAFPGALPRRPHHCSYMVVPSRWSHPGSHHRVSSPVVPYQDVLTIWCPPWGHIRRFPPRRLLHWAPKLGRSTWFQPGCPVQRIHTRYSLKWSHPRAPPGVQARGFLQEFCSRLPVYVVPSRGPQQRVLSRVSPQWVISRGPSPRPPHQGVPCRWPRPGFHFQCVRSSDTKMGPIQRSGPVGLLGVP
jgi:hypothetical protein